MTSLSLFAKMDRLLLNKLLFHLGIEAKNVVSYEEEAEFLSKGENGAFLSELQGDFNFLIDVELFKPPANGVESILKSLSLAGALFAVPDEEDGDPEVCLIWDMGSKRKARVVDDDNDKCILVDPLGKSVN